MRLFYIGAAFLGILMVVPVASAQLSDCQDLPTPPSTGLPSGLTLPAVDSKCPNDVTFSSAQTIENDQKAFDLFSWDIFVALNWPADDHGVPIGGSISDHPEAPRIWETFIAANQVFKPGGASPDPWNSENTMAKKLVPSLKKRQKVLFASSKNVLSEAFQAGFGVSKFPPIADLNGAYVFYEIHLSKIEYDYLVSNRLYSKAGQSAFLQKASPPNTIDFPKGSSSPQQSGAIELKAAWKQIGAGDDPGKFYTISAFRVDPVSHMPSSQTVTFGLVGLHVVTRTEKAAKWIWSTFEHVDNAPDVGATLAPSSHFNFNDPTKPQNVSGFDFRPPNNDPVPNPTTPTQITRVVNNNVLTSPWTKSLNQSMQAALAGSVWANYRLVTTQWPGPSGQFIPCHVTNTVAETYIQADSFAGSCMRCHNVATTSGVKSNGQKALANFSYLLQNGQ